MDYYNIIDGLACFLFSMGLRPFLYQVGWILRLMNRLQQDGASPVARPKSPGGRGACPGIRKRRPGSGAAWQLQVAFRTRSSALCGTQNASVQACSARGERQKGLGVSGRWRSAGP